jgi:hypothetical protein
MLTACNYLRYLNYITTDFDNRQAIYYQGLADFGIDFEHIVNITQVQKISIYQRINNYKVDIKMLLSIFAEWILTTYQTLWSQHPELSFPDNMRESLYLTDLACPRRFYNVALKCPADCLG